MFIEPVAPGQSALEEQKQVEAIVRQGPRGAIAVAGVAVVIVTAIWFAFYFLIFVPRN